MILANPQHAASGAELQATQAALDLVRTWANAITWASDPAAHSDDMTETGYGVYREPPCSRYVTGAMYNPNLLALILYAGYDHHQREAVAERTLQDDLQDLAVFNGAVPQFDIFHHGVPEGRAN